MSHSASTLSRFLAVGVLCAITLGVYGQLASFDFISYDDPFFIGQNPHVTGGLTVDNVLWSFSTSRMGIWHPLTWMSYQLEISVFGPDIPGVHHATNLLLHLLSSILVFVLCLRLSGAVWPSLLVAVLFSIHPQHVQPVAWISERKEVMAAAFFLISVNLYAVYRTDPGKKLLYLMSLTAFGIALLCKPSVAPLPLILILMDLFYRQAGGATGVPTMKLSFDRESGFLRLLRDKLPFLILALVVSAITIYIKKTGQWAQYEDTLHLGRRLLLMPIGFMHYMEVLFVPWPNPMWHDAPEGLPYVRSAVSAGILAVAAGAIWISRNRFPELLFGGLWFLIMWLPISGIVLVSNYYVADRYTYLPYIGAFFGLVFFVRRVLQSRAGWSRLCLPLGVSVVLVSAGLAYKQTGYWRDTITFFERESLISPDSPSAPIHVGQALLELGKAEEALRLFERSLELNNRKAKAHALKADALRALGRLDEAVSVYRDAIERHVERPDVYVQLGMLLREQGEFEGAAATMEQGLKRYPDDVYLLNHLAHIYGFTLGRADRSREYYERALEAETDNIHALLGLGILELREGAPSDGLARLTKVLEIDPENEPALNAVRTYQNR
ncbi:tetratricopeptide repeat protein [Pseudomonadota bacterium]